MIYVWFSRMGMLAFNDFFLGYVALFALSVFTFIGGLVTTDAERIQRRLDRRISRPLFSPVLALTAVGLAFL